MGNLDGTRQACARIRTAKDGGHAAAHHYTLDPEIVELVAGAYPEFVTHGDEFPQR